MCARGLCQRTAHSQDALATGSAWLGAEMYHHGRYRHELDGRNH